jgi:hypothetical protein
MVCSLHRLLNKALISWSLHLPLALSWRSMASIERAWNQQTAAG